MPNRIVREGWLTSRKVDNLDPNEERFFLRLLLKADDFGRYSADPVELKNTLFPLKESVRSTDSSRWLAACEKAGLVRSYSTAKGRFLEIFEFNQRTRAVASKYPPPDIPVSDTGPPDDGQPSGNGPASAHVFVDVVEVGGDVRACAPPQDVPSSLKTPAFMAAWARWQTSRRTHKKPKDWDEFFRSQLDWLAQFDTKTAIGVLEYSTINGYQGLIPPKANGTGGHSSTDQDWTQSL